MKTALEVLEPLATFAELGLGPRCPSFPNHALDRCATLPLGGRSFQGSREEFQSWVTFAVI